MYGSTLNIIFRLLFDHIVNLDQNSMAISTIKLEYAAPMVVST